MDRPSGLGQFTLRANCFSLTTLIPLKYPCPHVSMVKYPISWKSERFVVSISCSRFLNDIFIGQTDLNRLNEWITPSYKLIFSRVSRCGLQVKFQFNSNEMQTKLTTHYQITLLHLGTVFLNKTSLESWKPESLLRSVFQPMTILIKMAMFSPKHCRFRIFNKVFNPYIPKVPTVFIRTPRLKELVAGIPSKTPSVTSTTTAWTNAHMLIIFVCFFIQDCEI